MQRLACLYLTFLNSPGGITFQEVRRYMNWAYPENEDSARRKFERDKEILRSLGLNISYYAPGTLLDGVLIHKGIYVAEEEKDIATIPDLTDSEMNLLLEILHEAQNASETKEDKFNIKAIIFKLFYRNNSFLNHQQHAVASFDTGDTFHIVQDAISKGMVINFLYQKKDGVIRKASPRGLIAHKGRIALVAEDHGKKDIRIFYIDLMLDLTITQEEVIADPQFDIRNYSLHPLALKKHDPEKVTIEIKDEESDILSDFLRNLPPACKLTSNGNSYTFLTTNRNALFAFLMRNPQLLCGLGPTSIKESFLKHIDEIKNLYRDEI